MRFVGCAPERAPPSQIAGVIDATMVRIVMRTLFTSFADASDANPTRFFQGVDRSKSRTQEGMRFDVGFASFRQRA